MGSCTASRPRSGVHYDLSRARQLALERSKLRGFERITRGNVSRVDPAAEPAHPLLRAAVRERFRNDGALGLRLEAIVADRARGIEAFLDVALLQQVALPLRMVRPDAGET